MYMKYTNFGFKKASLHKCICMLHLTGMIMARIKNIYSYTVKGLQMKCTELHSNLPAHNDFFKRRTLHVFLTYGYFILSAPGMRAIH